MVGWIWCLISHVSWQSVLCTNLLVKHPDSNGFSTKAPWPPHHLRCTKPCEVQKRDFNNGHIAKFFLDWSSTTSTSFEPKPNLTHTKQEAIDACIQLPNSSPINPQILTFNSHIGLSRVPQPPTPACKRPCLCAPQNNLGDHVPRSILYQSFPNLTGSLDFDIWLGNGSGDLPVLLEDVYTGDVQAARPILSELLRLYSRASSSSFLLVGDIFNYWMVGDINIWWKSLESICTFRSPQLSFCKIVIFEFVLVLIVSFLCLSWGILT